VLAQLKLPKGFNIEVYASGMANARSLRQGEKGTVFAGSRLVDKVYAIINKDGKREAKVLVSGLYRPNGLAIHDGTLYIAELSKISKIENVEANLDNPKLVPVYDDLPKDEAHGWKFIAIGPDNKLYVPVASPATTAFPTTSMARSAA
jgi:glucose/arabinose dehydrogenase